MFFLQVIKGEEYTVRSDRNRVYTQYIPADRGVIYDRSGVVLARNKPSFSVAVLYNEIPSAERGSVVVKLSSITGVSEEDLLHGFDQAKASPYQVTVIIPVITHEQQLVVQSQQEFLPGVSILKSSLREYPLGKEFSAILGYTGIISDTQFQEGGDGVYTYGSSIGKTGIELEYEEVLRGVMGKSAIEVEASGKTHTSISVSQPIPGGGITVSIESVVQKKLFELLEKKISEVGAWGGSAIVSDVQTGEVYAMVSMPTYDNNVFESVDNAAIVEILSDSRSLLINRAISGLYSPGSTVKMALGAMALERGTVKPDTRISGSPQIITVGGWEFPDWTYAWGRGPHGLMDVATAIANSSDIFFYKVGGGYPPECGSGGVACEVNGLGVDGVVSALRAFGFGSLTNIDLPGENPGLVPDPEWKEKQRGEDWYLGNTYHLSIGQGDLLATPIQVLQETNIVATDSATMPLHVLAQTNDEEPRDIVPMKKPVSLDSLRIVRNGMIKAVSEGIVYQFRGGAVVVGAKTGTAEFGLLDAKGQYATHAWVTGFAPVENPQISFVFMLESGDSSQFAAEVAREFTDWYFGEYKK